MRIALVGLLCTLLAAGLTVTVGLVASEVVLAAFHPAASPGGGIGFVVGLDTMLVVMPSLIAGLCIAAPLMPRVPTSGLRSPGGIVLVLLIVAVQIGLPAAWLAGAVPNSGSDPAGMIFAVVLAVLPGLVGTALALYVFDEYARRTKTSRSVRTGEHGPAG